jgi:hypothetical protein
MESGEKPPSVSGADRRKHMPSKWHLALATMGVAAIAIGQPMLDLLGRTPDFFIARSAPTSDVVLLGIILGLVVPVAAAAVVVLMFHLRPQLGIALHAVVLVILGLLLAMSVLRQTSISEQPWPLTVGLSFLFGLLLAWGFHRSEWLARSLSIIGVAPLLVAAIFLLLSPSSEVAWSLGEEISPTTAPIGEPAPVVFVIFDEFPLASIIDPEGQIRDEQFPAFADLSGNSTWYRNAVGTQQGTRDAIPEMLSGISLDPGSKLPHFADHPKTLFTLLSRDYQIEAIETLTQLCPEEFCPTTETEQREFQGRWASLGQDLAIISGHLYLPLDLRQDLPPIDQNWGDFVPRDVTPPDGWNIRERLQAHLEDDRRKVVHQFLERLEAPLATNEFHFIHLPLPHRPWNLLPDGRVITGDSAIPGGGDGGWGSNPFLVEQAYQRHLLQVQYADQIVGSILSQLRSSGSYDETILVIAADHGIAIRPEKAWRSVHVDTVGDLAAIPLFIKAPHQSDGTVDDYRAETVDIVPTIAGLLGAEIPWKTDGTDLNKSARPSRTESKMAAPNRNVSFGVDGQEKLQIAEYHSQFFADRGPFGLAPPGYHDLLGKTVGSDFDASEYRAMWDSAEFYANVDLEGDHLPARLTGTLEGGPQKAKVLAVTSGSNVIALSQSWVEGDTHRFQVLLPPNEFRRGSNVFEILVVEEGTAGYTFTSAGRTGAS